MRKETILIVDDSEMNRSILADMLGESYEIIEAEDGVQALEVLHRMHTVLDLVLLDIVMPKMDGFEVLEIMNQNHWIDDIPVVMVSAESGSSQVERAYEMGVTDFIMRPFDSFIVRHRVVNTLLLYAKQKQLIGMVEEQLEEKEKYSNAMIDILSHIVEVRNGESGQHVLHVRAITDFLLRKLKQHTDKYPLTEDYITMISNASSLHDIGKIAIDEKILNKLGKLTDEEFEIMKTHSLIGARMLEGVFLHQDTPLVKTAYDICRWHHERYDGKGYPDGLKGEDIPISAQVVALADVYDALTSVRVYKEPFEHDTAVSMILQGECGAFNPLLLDCLREHSDDLRMRLEGDIAEEMSRREIKSLTDALLNGSDGYMSDRTLSLLDYERMKNDFFSAMSEEIQFEYTISTRTLKLSSWGANKLGVNEIILGANKDKRLQDLIGVLDWAELSKLMKQTTPENPEISFECRINCTGELRWHRMVIRVVWTEDDPPQCDRVLGKAIDIHDTHMKMDALRKRASRDALTGLLNFTASKIEIEKRLENNPDSDYMLVIVDMDYFKLANDTYGHQFGNDVLQHIADVLNKGLRSDDISARIGGDEFLLFLECGSHQEQVIKRIFGSMSVPYKDCSISVSMGIAKASDVGADYEAMFRAADQALYYAKENGRGCYCFYNDSMQNTLLKPRDKADNSKDI